MKTTFQPISELAILPSMGERVVVGVNEKKLLSFEVEALAGEKKEFVFEADVLEQASLEVTVFVRGEGEISLRRTVNVLGRGAKVSLKCSGVMGQAGRISASDDVRVTGEEAEVDVRTKIVLKDSAVSECRSRMVLEHVSRGTKAFARIDHLLLGEQAKGSSIPELDVRTDDVTCGHAASCSSLAPLSLQYLTGRGLDEQTASDLLVNGFLML